MVSSPPEVPEDDDDIDVDIKEELHNQMELDYDIGSTIRDKISPHAVSWFTREAVQGDDLEDIHNDDDDEDGNEDGDDEDDEEDADQDEERAKISTKKSSGLKKSMLALPREGQQSEHLPECKQQ
ncbi:Nucleosome assembly protein 1-like 4 [Camellia lanceoleosa]|uniref:Nucleosome assembly protein 1-like 4 n=1 Tax=Camellia lanceoleosa TaxID=1840588 RepID=A0ACC0FDN3_9ERIC|nr:Nucleosome assembly protein 1-like 4 [Camellia lanceoleosa]